MVNRTWKQPNRLKNPNWALFHFDSHVCTAASQHYALGFGKYLLEIDRNASVDVFEVPVIPQPPLSNDCGLYPAHFLSIILRDVDRYLAKCVEVSDYNLVCIHS